MQRICLTQGEVALVDDEDCEPLVSVGAWQIQRDDQRIYAKHAMSGGRMLLMHRAILNPPPHLSVDHINGNGLDNRRCNLRLATATQQQGNYRKPKNGESSRFKGVYYNGHSWIAQIGSNPRIYLGSFISEEEAARAYDLAAQERWGKFALINL